MAMTGYPVDPAVTDLYNNIKVGTSTCRGFTMHIDNKMVKILSKIESSSKDPFGEMVSQFEDNNTRYAVFDIKGKNTDGRDYTKMVFVYWQGPNAPVKERMTFAATKDGVKNEFKAIGFETAGKKDTSRPWVLDVLRNVTLASADGRAVKKAGNGEYSYA